MAIEMVFLSVTLNVISNAMVNENVNNSVNGMMSVMVCVLPVNGIDYGSQKVIVLVNRLVMHVSVSVKSISNGTLIGSGLVNFPGHYLPRCAHKKLRPERVFSDNV